MTKYFAFAGRTPVLLAALGATLALLLVFPALPIGGEMLDVRPGYGLAEVAAAMETYGEEGRRVYAWATATLDTLLPLAYVSLLAGLAYRLRPAERFGKAAFLPVAAGACDLAENALILVMLTGYPEITEGQVSAASALTVAKGTAVLLSFAWVAALAALAAASRIRRGPGGAR